jgi:hypothetical protein
MVGDGYQLSVSAVTGLADAFAEKHHYSDHELQVVPGRIHRSVAHQGSMSEIP